MGNDEQEFKVLDRRFWSEDEQAAEDSEEQRSDVPTYVQQLRNEVEDKDRRLREYIAAYKKEVGENLEETKRRLERDAEQRIKALRGEFAGPMMEVFEALERSLLAAQGTTDSQAMLQGLEMLRTLMMRKLKDLGIERIETVGAAFDPAVHEAVAVTQVEDSAQNNVVMAELSPGFSCDGRLVRAAKVQVGKA